MAASLFTAANVSLAAHFARRSNTHGKRYISYRALILTWKDAPAVGIAELELALGKTYGFQTDVFELPLQDTGESLEERLQLFIKAANNPSSLLLVCYIGNACIKKKRQIWTRPRQEKDNSVEIDWLHFQEMLEICPSDVILVTDCEYGTDPDLRASSEGSGLDLQKRRKRMEIVSAPQRIPEDKQPFLVSLSRELESIREPSFTLNRLISDLTQTMRHSPYYTNLGSPDQSSIPLLRADANKGTAVHLQASFKEAFNADVETQLKTWAMKAPSTIRAVKFADPTYEYSGVDQSTKVQRFTLVVSVTKSEALDQEEFRSWIGKGAPACLASICHKVRSPIAGQSFKAGDNEEMEKQLQGLVGKLNQDDGWQRLQDTRHGEYNRVVVLPLIWDYTGFDLEDDIEKDLIDLTNIFRKDFGFAIESTFRIPVGRGPEKSGQKELEKKIKELVNESSRSKYSRGRALGTEDLLIIVYSGHGKDTYPSGDRAVWSSGKPSGSSAETLSWSRIVDNLLDTSECDVAQILDCCYAATAAKAVTTSRNEILSACSREQTTFAGPASFTKIVISALKDLVKEGKPFSFQSLAQDVDSATARINDSRKLFDRIPTPHYNTLDRSVPPNLIILQPRAGGLRTSPASNQESLAQTGKPAAAYVYAEIAVDDLLQKVSTIYLTKGQLLEKWGASYQS